MEIQLSSIIIQMINFGIVVFIISKFIYKPVVKILKQRTEKIEQSQLEAAENSKKSQSSLKAADDTLLKAKKEASKIIADAKKEADKEASAIIAKAKLTAKESAETEKQSLLAAIESERQAVFDNLAQLVTDTTAQVLGNSLTDSQQHQLIESQLKQIKGVTLK